jgi:hypothetical protein
MHIFHRFFGGALSDLRITASTQATSGFVSEMDTLG